MNRLILVGNGFDLAHNLKTSYSDFILDYISSAVNSFYKNSSSIDPLLEIRQKYSGDRIRFQEYSTSKTSLSHLHSLQKNSYVVVEVKSIFLEGTIKHLSEVNWVDLENDYFEQLLALKGPKGYSIDKVVRLNTEFDFLKVKLEDYLLKHQNESPLGFSDEYSKMFCELIKNADIVTESVKDQKPNRLLLLSFNYTGTLENYKECCSKEIPTEINYIHGELRSATNPIIFGFGDEYNKDYLEFETLRNRELLKHIKSFGYFRTSNYHDLIRFTDADDFQVYILGHSLGLSDRTMLRQIFEHDACKSIKIFYHQSDKETNDYTTKTFDISSHFGDKGMMRKKVVPFNLSFPMPQVQV